jgi:D-alanyl-D-alanine carboxypeptidase/D-alanyl-D-alanine-endopeptidase (penicillin-binding protein 4)
MGGLVFNENTVDLEVEGRQVGQPARITWAPFRTDYVEVINRSRTVPYREEEDDEYQRTLGTNTIHVTSRLHPNGQDTESITVTDPTLYFTHMLRSTLLQEGISIDGRAVDLDETALTVPGGVVSVFPPLGNRGDPQPRKSESLRRAAAADARRRGPAGDR